MVIRWLHPRPSDYVTVWRDMQHFTATRTPDTSDEIWLTEHYPVYTLGQAGRHEHLLNTGNIPVVQTDRGGQVTYHGPGQVVAYVLFDLRRAGFFVREYVHRIEEAVMATLRTLGVPDAQRLAGAPGVYVPWPRPHTQHPDARQNAEGDAEPSPIPPDPQEAVPAHTPYVRLAKIAALGVKVRNAHTYHGVALNVDMDLSPFHGINPCGYAGLRTVDLASCGIRRNLIECGELLAAELTQQLTRPRAQ